jgi:hypothetical protein
MPVSAALDSSEHSHAPVAMRMGRRLQYPVGWMLDGPNYRSICRAEVYVTIYRVYCRRGPPVAGSSVHGIEPNLWRIVFLENLIIA